MNKARLRALARANEKNQALFERRLSIKLKGVFASLKVDHESLDIDWLEFQNDIENVLFSTGKRNMSSRVNFFLSNYSKELREDRLPIVARELTDKYMERVANKVTLITQTTQNKVRATIKQGRERGLKTSEIAQSIQSDIKGSSAARARMIARTEVGNMVNEADSDLANELLFKYKTWVHVGSGKVDRSNHIALDGVKIGINEEFQLGGGLSATYPHDERLPPEEVINCGCLIIYE